MDTEAQLFKALAEPVRLRILTLLLKGERCVCDIMAVLDKPQSTVSRHLAYMNNAGLISGRKQGVWMYYQLAKAETDLHAGLISLLNSSLLETSQSKKDLDALAKHVAEKDNKSAKKICFKNQYRRIRGEGYI